MEHPSNKLITTATVVLPLTSVKTVLKNCHIYPIKSHVDIRLKGVCIKVEVPYQHHVSWRKDRTNHWGQNPFLKCKKGIAMQLQVDGSWISGFLSLSSHKLMFYSNNSSGEQNSRERYCLPLEDILETTCLTPTKKNVVVQIRTSKPTWNVSGKKRDADKLMESISQAQKTSIPQKIEHWDFMVGFQGSYENVVDWNGVYFDVSVAKVIVLKEHPKFGFSLNDDIVNRPDFFHQVSIYEHDSHEKALHKLVYPQFRLSGLYALQFHVTYGNYLFEIDYTINVEVRGGKYPKKTGSLSGSQSRRNSPKTRSHMS
eukprot:TRINITY_DN4074_c0_g1_i1.p1 TRINITY_DN4074_c0_g1~~TRINITY_DN4074_c0_g1_i1.p1  ORF type:complete len:313 (-),score=55.64 TRINITY_DN4074_c0_g1_i1:671-1609(-)